MFRFLHTADLHLDSALQGLAGLDTQGSGLGRTATRDALVALVDLALAENVALVVIAGDLYDGDWRDYHTGLFFVEQMGRLADQGIPVVVAQGNHDAESRITRSLILPPTVRVFGSRRPETFVLDLPGGDRVALHGQSYKERAVTDNLALDYPAPVPGCFNMGVLHTGLGGLGGHANYAPCALSDLLGRGYDYWALGHVHQHTVVHRHPPVVFPGTPQGRHAREPGPKSVTLVEVDNGQVTALETSAVDTVRWAVLDVTLADCPTRSAVEDRLAQVLADAVATQGDGRLLACRLILGGETPAHTALLAGQRDLEAQARAAALGLGPGRAWVESVRLETRPPTRPAPSRDSAPEAPGIREGLDALAGLDAFLDEAARDPDLVERLRTDLDPLVRRLPAELATVDPDDPGRLVDDPALVAALTGDAGALIAAVRPFLMARLDGGDA
ncbi:metallophosphoesterase family protein [Pararhodospirillum oryzae]|uniref:Metallophosphoesterase n=1 Tax=Pararhodospirillum oryzae TaxID=478448 RepID=A0A512H993_9PROT|nr:DNA repair exonuclease [Pararhodospirillum oryzae]GEO82029.1 metallophosphoesterase [Pararhodospirillum oryzae]